MLGIAMKKIFLDTSLILSVILVSLAILVSFILVELCSPIVRVYSEPMEFTFDGGPGHLYTPEQRAEIDAKFEESFEEMRRGKVDPDRRRLRIDGPLYFIWLPLILVGFFAKEWKCFLALYIFGMTLLSTLGFFFLVEIALGVGGFMAGFIASQKRKRLC